MEEQLLEKYFNELKKENMNENYIKELEESIETISKEEIVDLIKKYYGC